MIIATISPAVAHWCFCDPHMQGNPQALSMQVDFFSQQDLSAYTSYAHHCVTETVQKLMKELERDPTGLNTKSKGFLELW